MTKEQFERYEKINKELAGVRGFLSWAGEKHRHTMIAKYRFSLKLIRHFSGESDNTFQIPLELQDRIIKIIEEYIDEKETELSEI